MAQEKGLIYGCPQCGCTDVEVTAWVTVNGNEYVDGDPPDDGSWCPFCEENDLGFTEVPALLDEVTMTRERRINCSACGGRRSILNSFMDTSKRWYGPCCAEVTCKLCEETAPVATSHPHRNGWVCDGCWDERLRITA